MHTKVLKIDKDNFSQDELKEASEIIRSGGLVAFPTETVYGLGGNAFDPEAASKIYAAKGRPSDNPLIVHIADMDGLRKLVAEVPPCAEKLAAGFWPGPMTLVLRKKTKKHIEDEGIKEPASDAKGRAQNEGTEKDADEERLIPDRTTGGLDTVAIRMPVHPVAAALIRESGVPIAAPSANRSGRPSTTTAQHCVEDLDGLIPMIIDGGAVEIGLESTIVDCTGDIPMLLRPGGITLEMLRNVVGRVDIDPAILGPMDEGVRPKAPGMKYRHYAPKADLTIVMGSQEKVQDKINELAGSAAAQGKKVGIIATMESRNAYHTGDVKIMGLRSDEATVAHNLFAILREYDDDGVDVIYSEGFNDDGIGRAIMNRLKKAAGYHILEV